MPTFRPLFDIHQTFYGGRGAFASCSIPQGALVLACTEPYASVVLRKFRKEVCGWCFKYAFEHGKNAWSIRLESDKSRGKSEVGTGIWFCSAECKNTWKDKEKHPDLKRILNSALEKLFLKTRARQSLAHTGGSSSLTLDYFQTKHIVADTLEEQWKRAESQSSTIAPNSSITISLDELEFDTAKFVIDGLARRCIEETFANKSSISLEVEDVGSINTTSLSCSISNDCIATGAGLWSDLLQLQNNELAHIEAKPYIIASHINVYIFVREVISLASADLRQSLSEDNQPIVEKLLSYVASADTVRGILGRDHGNVFGIWEAAPDAQESEMLGWGLYVSGSYFNHDCNSNLVKRRSGRSMLFYTTRDVMVGEELCISYVDVADGVDVKARRSELERDWYFRCCCKRCESEEGQ